MRYRRNDIVEHALVVLDAYGLADLSMRRLAGELGLQPSALYHHVANKQALLALVADEILRRGARPRPEGPWADQVAAIARELRDAMLAYRDGAELVATVHAFGLGAAAPAVDLAAAYDDAGLPAELVPVAVSTVLHFVFGDAIQEQTHLQASSVGAIADQPREGSDFELGLALILDGIRVQAGETVR
ncbi:TetR family transcriptional regulator [Nocardioides sp. JQ2195]|uniref:TetR/AcrR family transcriptional regulator C-terminal domain-containing protein n=1 Tax=Nocardioides sp. JQ2195 TaxID=2592334 RepID=UPI00143E405E|nr:TetR/AcrR family transcriptional regulator C-terminal domain-containing protein [Nocardioides sp. JQ2195]QIX26154.1 TetR family transcriptional regulator [Nocardioides sp. JQ2195]